MGISMQAAGEALRDLVKGLKGRKVAVLGHMRPDGDCIGSQTALCRMLQAEGVDSVCVNRDRIPPNLVPYAEGVTFIKGADYDATDRVAVTVDCADASRVGTELLAKFPAGILANIDHHASNPDYAQTNIVVREAAFRAGHDGDAGLHQRFAGHTGIFVLGEDGIQDGVRDLVAHLVGMALGDRLGREGERAIWHVGQASRHRGRR